MSDVEKYIAKRKAESEYFAKHFETGYENFKIGFLLRQAREETGVTQEKLTSENLLHETPWECYGAFKNDPTWGELFDDIERRRSSE